MDSFQNRLKVKTIKEDLAKLPTGLAAYDVAYDNAMERIQAQPQELRDCATKALSLILCAKRPLRTSEITYALMLEPGDTEIDEDNELDIEVIVASSAALLTLDEESQTVRFVHYTTQEYLQRMQDKWLPRAEAEMVSICTVAWEVAYNRRNGELDKGPEFDSYASKYGLGHFDAMLNDDRYAEDDHTEFWLPLQDTARVDAAMPPDWLFWRKCTRPTGKTAAHWSASLGLTGILTRLISGGHDVNLQDSNQATPLMYAAHRGNNAAISLLLRSDGVKVNAADVQGETALLYAVQSRHVKTVRALLTECKGINLNHRSHSGDSALHRAVYMACHDPKFDRMTPQATDPAMDIVKLLIDIIDLDTDLRDGDGRTPLSHASESGMRGVVEMILESGKADVNSRDCNGISPLSFAAFERGEAVVSLLIKHGAIVDSRCDLGRTALHYAAMNGGEFTVRLLLDSGAAVDMKCDSGRTALHYAAETGGSATVRVMLDSGAPVDSKCNSGTTPLCDAIAIHSPKIVKLLLDAGADATSRDIRGATPLFHLSQAECYPRERKLIKRLLRRLLSLPGVDPNTKDCYGRTLLSHAAEVGDPTLVQLLCDIQGVDVESSDDSGQTPLCYAYNSEIAPKAKMEALCRAS